ncbi:MAG: DUF805 domain-containing protein [Caulobacterales bacterium]|nr:DUF805 domain-containing protein [Caulobacterales bacterium]
MSGQVDLAELLLSSTGRLARGAFLIVAAVLIGLTALYEATPPTLHLLTGWFVYPALLFVGACVLSKRLHDRGRSGWWSAVILLAVIIVWPAPRGFFDFVFSLVLIWAVIELGVMPGEPGANRFGPNPQAPPARA